MTAESPRGPVASRHAANVEQSLKELQDKVEEYQEELESLQRHARPPNQALAGSKTAPFEVMKVAFEKASQDAPFMSSAVSVLPALLALRKAQQTIVESKEYLATQTTSIDETKRRLEREEAALADQRLLTTSLEQRIQSLQSDLQSRQRMNPEQVARERMQELQRKKRDYDRETTRLFRDLNKFIDDHLAAQLAAEDLGGPVVGDMMEIDSEDLAAGFNAHGRPKKVSTKPDASGKRQRRLEEVWGAAITGDDDDTAVKDEAAAAAREMRDLTEELLNKSIEAGGDSSAAYVTLPKETAAARFLVRSKVAQFDPRDATCIRLIDFGRDFDD